jgi:outer membrane immunogenic protein
MRKTLVALFVLALGSGSAMAADLGPYGRGSVKDYGPPPAYRPAFTWSGFYVGVQAGYGWGDTDARTGTLSAFNEAYSYNTSGALGGVHAGYNWQAQSIVLGLETDIEVAGIDGSGIGTLGSTHTTQIDWLGSFRGRVGVAADRTLFYLTGGLAYADIDTAGPSISNSDWRTGWTLGGGIEHAFTPNITARIEYRYTDLGSDSFGSTRLNRAQSSDVTFNAVRAGLSFRF